MFILMISIVWCQAFLFISLSNTAVTILFQHLFYFELAFWYYLSTINVWSNDYDYHSLKFSYSQKTIFFGSFASVPHWPDSMCSMFISLLCCLLSFVHRVRCTIRIELLSMPPRLCENSSCVQNHDNSRHNKFSYCLLRFINWKMFMLLFAGNRFTIHYSRLICTVVFINDVDNCRLFCKR